MEDLPTDSYDMNVTFLKDAMWCQRAETPLIFTSWPSCDLHLSSSGIRKEVRGRCLGQHGMCLTSHELHTPVHKAICHTQPPDTGFISQRGKPHQTPSPARHTGSTELKVILLLSALGVSLAHIVSSMGGSSLGTWDAPRKQKTAEKETHRELTLFHLKRRLSSSIAISKQLHKMKMLDTTKLSNLAKQKNTQQSGSQS